VSQQQLAQTMLTVVPETWRNPGQGRVVIKRLDHLGQLSNEEMVNAGATFTITALERKLNQNLAYSPEQDFFANGTLVPVDLIEGSDAAREFADNPHLVSDAEMQALVTPVRGARKAAADEAFLERLATITNATTLSRLAQLAEEEDAPISRVRAIQARLAQVEGLGLQQTGMVPGPDGGAPSSDDAPRSEIRRPGTARPVTPR
jgi:hypothetical protein